MKETERPVEVLLIEDNPDDATLAMKALREFMTNEIVWLKDGEEAMNFLFGKGEYSGRDITIKPKVILLDLKMPKVDGTELLQILRMDKLTKNIPVVVMTSSKEDSDLKKCYEYGVNSYVVKPIDFGQFIKAARQISMYWLLVNEPPNLD
ncbi:MAG: response regulator [Cyclobacteriaceae bacterium]|nr:response regulator [Cyclobacteriaceae bacterium SS2]